MHSISRKIAFSSVMAAALCASGCAGMNRNREATADQALAAAQQAQQTANAAQQTATAAQQSADSAHSQINELNANTGRHNGQRG